MLLLAICAFLQQIIVNDLGFLGHKTSLHYTYPSLITIIQLSSFHQAKSKGYMFFGIQFYGECWNGSQGHLTYAKYGPSPRCTDTAPLVGKGWRNHVYMINKG